MFDAVGAMAKFTVDLALMTEVLLGPEARQTLSDDGLLPSLASTFVGLGVEFRDPDDWYFP